MRLILFDIDGTLITARGAGRRAVKRALLAVFGTIGSIDTLRDVGQDRPADHLRFDGGGRGRSRAGEGAARRVLRGLCGEPDRGDRRRARRGHDARRRRSGASSRCRRWGRARSPHGQHRGRRAHQARPHGPLALLRPRRLRLRRSRSPPAPVAGGAPGARAPRPPVPRGGSDGDRRHAPRRRLRAPLRRRRGGGGHGPLHPRPARGRAPRPPLRQLRRRRARGAHAARATPSPRAHPAAGKGGCRRSAPAESRSPSEKPGWSEEKGPAARRRPKAARRGVLSVR